MRWPPPNRVLATKEEEERDTAKDAGSVAISSTTKGKEKENTMASSRHPFDRAMPDIKAKDGTSIDKHGAKETERGKDATNICYKCGQYRHCARNCRVQIYNLAGTTQAEAKAD